MTSIEVKNLSKSYGDQRVLDQVDLHVEKGELFFLLGASGCGKTTLLRSIAGFVTPDEGRIFLGEKEITRLPAHKRETAMVFQNYALWPHLTVEANVRFGLEEQRLSRPDIRERTEKGLESVQMLPYAQRRIGELSGGQQQRVALARALVMRPKALLLDEPLSNLDAKLRLEMRGEIRRICKEFGLTAIYVTHDQKEALSIADRLALMEGGRMIQVGKPEEVYRLPKNRSVAGFMGETNFISGHVLAVLSDTLRIESPLGAFEGIPARPSHKFSKGDAVTLSIRPESWSLQNDAKTTNCIRGKVESSTYLGETAQYTVRRGEFLIKVLELNPRFEKRSPDQDVLMHVHNEDVVVLEAEN